MKYFSRVYYTKNFITNGVRNLRKLSTTAELFNYVSLGDSITTGYAIDDNWQYYYGRGSEYGENGNKSTASPISETTIVSSVETIFSAKKDGESA